jgi:hypothetical protein
MSAFFAIVRQTVVLSFRIGGGTLVSVLFFMSVLIVVPFGIGPNLQLLAQIGGSQRSSQPSSGSIVSSRMTATTARSTSCC